MGKNKLWVSNNSKIIPKGSGLEGSEEVTGISSKKTISEESQEFSDSDVFDGGDCDVEKVVEPMIKTQSLVEVRRVEIEEVLGIPYAEFFSASEDMEIFRDPRIAELHRSDKCPTQPAGTLILVEFVESGYYEDVLLEILDGERNARQILNNRNMFMTLRGIEIAFKIFGLPESSRAPVSFFVKLKNEVRVVTVARDLREIAVCLELFRLNKRQEGERLVIFKPR